MQFAILWLAYFVLVYWSGKIFRRIAVLGSNPPADDALIVAADCLAVAWPLTLLTVLTLILLAGVIWVSEQLIRILKYKMCTRRRQ